MRKVLTIVAAILVVLGVVFALGPRPSSDATVTFDPATIGADPDAYLANSEAGVAGIRDGLQKEIVWAFPNSKSKTPWSIVYVHGFSASKGEVRPLPDAVAAALGANLFYTRLTGHGRDGQAMLDGSVAAWANDYAEALAIGRMIGERVIVIATSTGAGIATLEASGPGGGKDVAAYVFISPNFGIRDSSAFVLTLPWGRQIAELVAGKERSFKPVNEAHGRLWTSTYPTAALLPMAMLTRMAAGSPVERVAAPALFILSDDDKVVRPEVSRLIAARWGGRGDVVAITGSDDPYNHVIAGDALSPSTTADITRQILAWLRR